MNEEESVLIEKEVFDLLAQLGIEAQIKVTGEDSEEGELIKLQLESPQAASLIGFHGETLQALQLLLSFVCHQKLDRWVKTVVDVGDYRLKREDQLRKLALSLAMKAKFSGETQMIPNLNSAERRFIHMLLAENADVYSESEGEGRQRQLTIKPKK